MGDADPAYRDLGTESVYEYGSRASLYRVLRVINRVGVPMTAFAAARALELNPEAAEWLVRSAHEICSHGYRWAEQWRLSPEDEGAQIALAVETFERVTGTRPAGCYSRWMPSPHTRELLVDHGGFVYDSDAYIDDLPYWVTVGRERKQHLVVPYSLTYNDSADSYGTSPHPPTSSSRGRRRSPHDSVGLHPRLSGQAARASAVQEFLQYASGLDDV